MTGFIINTPFTDTSLPIGTHLDDAVRDNANLSNWWQADANSLTLSGTDVTAWEDLMGGSSLTTSPSAVANGVLVDAVLGAFSACDFDAANDVHYRLPGQPLWTEAWSVAIVARMDPNEPVGNKMLLGAGSGATFWIGRSGAAGSLRARMNGGTAVATGVTEEDWFCLIASYDGSGGISISVNGGAVATAAGADPNVTGPTVLGGISDGGGSYWNGQIADLLVWDYDIHDAANADDLQRVLDFMSGVYGIG